MLSPRLMPLILFPLALALSLGLFAGLGWIIQGPSGNGLGEKNPRLALNWVQLAGETEVETLKPPPPPPPPPPPETQQQSTSSSASRSEFAISDGSGALNLPLPAIDTGLGATAAPSLQNLGRDFRADVPVFSVGPRFPPPGRGR